MISLLSEIRWDWNTSVKYKTLYRGDAAAIIQKNCYGTEEKSTAFVFCDTSEFA